VFGSLSQNPLLFSCVFVFFAELGDKTLYTVVVLATRARWLPVLLGGWGAFVAQGLIAVGLGSLVARLPHAYVRWGTALAFFGCGLWLLFKAEEDEGDDEEAKAEPSFARQLGTSFVLVFAAEFGDATQIGSAALVARFRAPVQVFIGATLGLWAGTVLAVVVGRLIGKKLPAHILRKTAGVLFVAFAVLTVWRG
jgi:putative Ca2+/H+ antiporter (TMEM165/GDT1 family)